MRILFVTNFYPPYHKSGDELSCRDIVESLKTRGHHVRVLTSTYGTAKTQVKGDIHRSLSESSKDSLDWHVVFLKELINQVTFKKLCNDFQPEIVFFFNLSHISISLELLAKEMGLPTCFYISNNWFTTWKIDHWYQVWPKDDKGSKILRYLTHHFKLLPPSQHGDFKHPIFTCQYLKNLAEQVGKIETFSSVIPRGVDVNRFSFREADGQKPSRFLYVGQIKPGKGIDIAIKAMGILKREHGYDGLTMTIVGDDKNLPYYVTYLRDLADTYGVLKDINFVGRFSHEKMPDLYFAHDILVLPSECEETLSLTVLEAMSSGLAVVSTAKGGNAEILDDEFNALFFPKENVKIFARQLLRLVKEPELFESMRANARKTVEQGFRIELSVDSVEGVLKNTLEQAHLDRQGISLEKGPLISERDSFESLTELIIRAKKWLKIGKVVSLARGLVKPRFLIPKLRKAFQKTYSFVWLIIFPIFLEGFFLISGRRPKSPTTKPRKRQKVLVVQLADIGDIVLTSPFLRELRRFMPYAWITLVVQPGMISLVEKCPYVDEVIPFNWRAVKKWKTAFQGHIFWWLQSIWISLRCLWKRPFDMAISPRWNNDPCLVASLILMYTSGASQRIAYIDSSDDYKLKSLRDANRLITQGPVRDFPKHEVEHQMKILSYLGAEPAHTKLELWTTPEDEHFARNVLNQYSIESNNLLIAFGIGAAWSLRRWPTSRFIELGKWLQENYNAYILIVAGKNEKDMGFQIERELQSKRTINLAGKTTLREMASIFRFCKLFVGNDSGPMHVAAAAGVCSVGLFGPGEYGRFKPWGSNHEVVHLGFSCNPCSENCKFEEPYCIKEITVSQVKEILYKKLKSILVTTA